MSEGTLARLFGNVITKSLGCSLISTTGTITFRERLSTRRAPKSSFVNDKIDLIGPKPDVSFDPLTAIMNLATLLPTFGADRAPLFGSHMHLDAFAWPPTLTQDLKFRHIQRHDDPLVWLVPSSSLLIYAMLL
jgi:hypothetical protein